MPLFSATLIPDEINTALPAGYSMRPLEREDYTRGFLDVLRVLTTVGDIPQEAWEQRYDWMLQRNEEYFIVCVVDPQGKIVGVGSLVLEKKLYVPRPPAEGAVCRMKVLICYYYYYSLRNLGVVGHIEDISVAKDQQGKKLGLRIIQALDAIAQAKGAYKAILDCSEHNRPFYEKCGYKLAGVQMVSFFLGGRGWSVVLGRWADGGDRLGIMMEASRRMRRRRHSGFEGRPGLVGLWIPISLPS
jgi:glucosamine-phosphate N-acetyltransferase